MEATRRQCPDFHPVIFTLVPEWFFAESLDFEFDYHPLLTDIGLAQNNPLEEDIPRTVAQLNDFIPFDGRLVSDLAFVVSSKQCRAVMCDISALGIAVARAANLPSVLVENFTWDWIYEGYSAESKRIEEHGEYFAGQYQRASYRIQTRPVCNVVTDAHLTTGPVYRHARLPREQTRKALGIPEKTPVVTITMGGMTTDYAFLAELANRKDLVFVVPGGSDALVHRGNLVCLPVESEIYHPDLVAASDVVVGKLGYSTVTEAYAARAAFGYVGRPRFKESPVIAEFVLENMHAKEISQEDFVSGTWLNALDELLQNPRHFQPVDGARDIAEFLLRTLM